MSCEGFTPSVIFDFLLQKLLISLKIFRNVLPNNVKFEVDIVANVDIFESRIFKSVGNNGDRKRVFNGIHDRQTDAVDAN